MQKIWKQYLAPYGLITLGCAIYAVGFNWCYVPNQIGFGGMTGIAQIINYILPWFPIGMAVILLNIPTFLLGWKFLGGHVLVSSLYAMFVSSLMIDMLTAVHTFEPMDPMLACIFGGVLLGVSLGLVFLPGAPTGGTDLVARLVKLKINWLPMGQVLLAVDLMVILAVAAAFRNIYSAMYGIIGLYISSMVMDGMLYGMDHAKVAYIISDRHKEIVEAIIHDMDRGVTVLHGEGAYSGAEKQVLMVAFKQRQIVALKRTVKELDPAAFLIVCEAHEVLGDGFRTYKQNDL